MSSRRRVGTPRRRLSDQGLVTKPWHVSPAVGTAGEPAGAGAALLVLDNCEHVLDAVIDVVSKLRAAAPELHILTTSREALRTQGETVSVVEPLRADAVRLFGVRALESKPGFEVGAWADVIAEICDRLDGLPLAIELAAGADGRADAEVVAVEDGGAARSAGRCPARGGRPPAEPSGRDSVELRPAGRDRTSGVRAAFRPARRIRPAKRRRRDGRPGSVPRAVVGAARRPGPQVDDRHRRAASRQIPDARITADVRPGSPG